MVSHGHPTAVRKRGGEDLSNQLSNNTQRYRCTSTDLSGRVTADRVE
jgi:hypothetical protein